MHILIVGILAVGKVWATSKILVIRKVEIVRSRRIYPTSFVATTVLLSFLCLYCVLVLNNVFTYTLYCHYC